MGRRARLTVVGINALKGGIDLCLKAALVKNGFEPGAASPLELPPPQSAASIEQGQIDAAILSEPFGGAAKQAGLTKVGDACVEGLPEDSPFGIFFTSEDAKNQNPELMGKFTEGLKKSIDFAQENPEELKAQMSELSKGATAPEQINVYKNSYETPDAVWDEFIGLMVDFEFLGSAESVQSFFK